MSSVIRVLALVSVLFLGACVTVAPPSLPAASIQQFRIADVTVEGIEVIQSWPVEEGAVVKGEHLPPETVNRLQSEPASNFPVMRAHFQRVLSARFKSEFAAKVSPLLNGARPVKAVVRLKKFDVPSVARRILVDQHAKLQMDIDLVDPVSGAILLHYEGPFQSQFLMGGVSTVVAVAVEQADPTLGMTSDYIGAYGSWLLKN